MITDDALVKLGQSTMEAVAGVLEMFAPGEITAGEVAVVAPERHPLEDVPVPAVATMVSYVDGVTGGNLFVMTVAGARKLAAAMMGMEPDETAGAAELSELELSAVAEAMNQMMASAAGATTAALGTEVENGLFATSFRVFEVLFGLPLLVLSVALPLLSVAGAEDVQRLRFALQRMTEVALAASVLLVLVLVPLAQPAVELLGGEEYADAGRVLRIQALALVPVFLGQTWQLGIAVAAGRGGS